MYSGAVAEYGYAAVSRGDYDVVVLVGPSHYKQFE
jgi:AmmeMemoRadiSam system protein B